VIEDCHHYLPLLVTVKSSFASFSGTVGHSKEYHERFKEATVGVEGCFPFISGLDVYVIEIPVDIKFCEVLGSMELGNKFGDEGERVFVLDSHGAQYVVVLN